MISSPPLVYELRQYILVPGTRALFTELFERELLESQEATGMLVVGQFHDFDRPDTFTWVRAFADMASRHQSLEAFYGGPVWAKHRNAANSMLVDNDDVLLLAPTNATTSLVDSMVTRASSDDTQHDAPSTWEVVVRSVEEEHTVSVDREIQDRVASMPASKNPELVATFITEKSKNTFTRLPVRENEHVFVTFSRFDKLKAKDAPQLPTQHDTSTEVPVAGMVWRAPLQRLRLSPTPRSALR